jgi:hypothetical protein
MRDRHTDERPPSDELPEWAQWKGEGPPPAYWWATDPETGASTKVYRSYEDYCDD